MTLDLDAPLPLPAWLPDETLYSLLSRYHALSGHGSAAQTAFALFGRDRAGTQHDFPQHLDALCAKTVGVLGSPEEICRQRTVLSFYLPLRPLEDQSAAVDSLRGPSQGMLKYRLGLLTSRFRANHPLKACPDCMRDDAVDHGIAYWHRTHQFPGVWICPNHGTALAVASVKSNGALRFGWVLPAASQLRPASPAPHDALTGRSLSQFADLARNWSALPAGCSIASAHLAAVYRRRIVEMGLPVRRTAIAEHYAASTAPLRAIPELQALPASTSEARPQIDRWVFNPRGSTHPLRHEADYSAGGALSSCSRSNMSLSLCCNQADVERKGQRCSNACPTGLGPSCDRKRATGHGNSPAPVNSALVAAIHDPALATRLGCSA